MVRHELTFNVEGTQRTLAPSVPVRLDAKNEKQAGRDLSASLGFMFFKTYTFSFSRGSKRRVRIRSADGVPLSWSRYVFERLDFKLRGVNSLPKPNEEPIDL